VLYKESLFPSEIREVAGWKISWPSTNSALLPPIQAVVPSNAWMLFNLTPCLIFHLLQGTIFYLCLIVFSSLSTSQFCLTESKFNTFIYASESGNTYA
jgi:hypothetical protein